MRGTDIDGDGDVDVLAHGLNEIVWYENREGNGTFGEPQFIVTSKMDRFFFLPTGFFTDLDGDGDVDVVWAGDDCLRGVRGLGVARENCTYKFSWNENTDSRGTFGPKRVISEGIMGPELATNVSDIDGDGDKDVLLQTTDCSTDPCAGRLAWYENIDGKGTFSPENVISTDINRHFVVSADLDGDGDLDVLSTSSNSLVWYENTDGRGHFGLRNTISSVESLAAVHIADLDADGDTDVLSDGREEISWYENVTGEFLAGDANGDFQFDQLDLIQVLQAARFLTGEAATFEEGDWNGDRVFNQLDIIAAIQTGNYLQGPYAVRTADTVFSAFGA